MLGILYFQTEYGHAYHISRVILLYKYNIYVWFEIKLKKPEIVVFKFNNIL